MQEPIRVWRFHDAPIELQHVSTNGGDEDWLMEIPWEYDGHVDWIYERAFGCSGVDEYKHPTKVGWRIKIGSHA